MIIKASVVPSRPAASHERMYLWGDYRRDYDTLPCGSLPEKLWRKRKETSHLK